MNQEMVEKIVQKFVSALHKNCGPIHDDQLDQLAFVTLSFLLDILHRARAGIGPDVEHGHDCMVVKINVPVR